MEPRRRGARARPALILLLAPFVGLLFPGWWARADPRLWGIPFFVWYQFAWVIGGVLVTALVYRLVGEGEA